MVGTSGFLSEVVLVCMSVHNGSTVEFKHSLCIFLARAAHDAITMKFKDRKIEDDARTSPEMWKTVNYST